MSLKQYLPPERKNSGFLSRVQLLKSWVADGPMKRRQ